MAGCRHVFVLDPAGGKAEGVVDPQDVSKPHLYPLTLTEVCAPPPRMLSQSARFLVWRGRTR